ncbi:MAG TPA: Clp protease N-terminal domain-containing protein [Bryobacteraceae bacterium]|nr:Clp protease N-terminal domain-containing protein [Bryobacteraceae bacterium]
MFERYTEKARRTIFFARYEASQFGSQYVEAEHLLLGVLREDKALANRFLCSHAAVEAIRKRIEDHTPPAEKVPTSVDMPLSHDCKRVLAYGAEEAERLHHKHIGTEHLLLGMLRETESFAARLLGEQGLTLDSVRQQIRQGQPLVVKAESASFARFDQWLAGCEARGGIYALKQKRIANRTTQFSIYAVDPPGQNEKGQDVAPAEKLTRIQKRIDRIVEEMERAIANHEFEQARSYSDQERKERDDLRLLREQFHLEQPSPRVPLLCIEIILDERFSEIQKRCDGYLAEGVPEVWLLDPELKRAYTVTTAEGFRECRGGILRMANPPLEMELKTIFE